ARESGRGNLQSRIVPRACRGTRSRCAPVLRAADDAGLLREERGLRCAVDGQQTTPLRNVPRAPWLRGHCEVDLPKHPNRLAACWRLSVRLCERSLLFEFDPWYAHGLVRSLTGVAS